MKTMVNVTRQSNLPVLYGSETPGIWLIKLEHNNAHEQVCRLEENPFLGF